MTERSEPFNPYAVKMGDRSIVLRIAGWAPQDMTDDDLLEVTRVNLGLQPYADRGTLEFAVKDVSLCDSDLDLADKIAAEHQPVVDKIHSTEISCTCGMPDADWRSSHDADEAFDYALHILALAGWDVTDGG